MAVDRRPKGPVKRADRGALSAMLAKAPGTDPLVTGVAPAEAPSSPAPHLAAVPAQAEEPAPAEVPAAPAPAPAPAVGEGRTEPAAPPKPKPAKITFEMSPEEAGRARAAYLMLPHGVRPRTWSAFVASALMRATKEIEAEYNGGSPFETVEAGEIPTGRPVGG